MFRIRFVRRVIPLIPLLIAGMSVQANPADASSTEIQINDSSYLSTISLKLESQPYLLWECRSKQVLLPNLFMEAPGVGGQREILAVGSLSPKPGCSDSQPFRYDYNLKVDQSLVDDIERIKPVGYFRNKNDQGVQELQFYLASLPFPENRAVAAVGLVKIQMTSSGKEDSNYGLNSLGNLGFDYGTVANEVNYSSGLIKTLSVTHNRNEGTAEMRLNFRYLPSKGQIISFGISSSYSGLRPTSGMVCSETEGAQLRNFPNLKLSYPNSGDYKVKLISLSGKTLKISWIHPDLKASNSWSDGYSQLPTCFGVSTWSKKREYSSGTNCSGFINNGFLDANCQPYAGWNSWEEVDKSWRVLLKPPTI